jgi:DNA-binding winged helix-turn-helix (wHTH) protein/tetratricopeptide (TPR) repeat protein
MVGKFSFGPFRFDQSSGVLLVRETEKIHLAPRELRVLEFLLENRGKRVSYEQLAQAVWRGKSIPDDFTSVLQNVVLRIKNMLRQRAAEELANLIVPVAKFGYYFTWHGPGLDEAEDLTPVELRALQTHRAGLQHLSDRNVESMVKAMELFEVALSQNRKLAPALCGMADCLFLLGTAPYATLDAREAFPQATAHAEEALKVATVEADIVSARTTLAIIDMLHHWNWRAAEEAFCKIIADHPADGRSRQFYAHLLVCTRRYSKALRQIAKGTELEASSRMILMTEGMIQYFSEHYELAASTFAHTANLYPRFSPAHVWVGILSEHFGQIDLAITAFERSFAIEGLPYSLAGLGYLYARQGDQIKFQRTLERLEELERKRRVSPWFYALMYAGAADSDRVREHLEAAVEERCDFLIHCALEPRFEQFRVKSWFDRIVKQIFNKRF